MTEGYPRQPIEASIYDFDDACNLCVQQWIEDARKDAARRGVEFNRAMVFKKAMKTPRLDLPALFCLGCGRAFHVK